MGAVSSPGTQSMRSWRQACGEFGSRSLTFAGKSSGLSRSTMTTAGPSAHATWTESRAMIWSFRQRSGEIPLSSAFVTIDAS